MKLNPNSIQHQIFKHPWYKHVEKLNKPNPPTKAAIQKAQFVDKTFNWNGK